MHRKWFQVKRTLSALVYEVLVSIGIRDSVTELKPRIEAILFFILVLSYLSSTYYWTTTLSWVFAALAAVPLLLASHYRFLMALSVFLLGSSIGWLYQSASFGIIWLLGGVGALYWVKRNVFRFYVILFLLYVPILGNIPLIFSIVPLVSVAFPRRKQWWIIGASMLILVASSSITGISSYAGVMNIGSSPATRTFIHSVKHTNPFELSWLSGIGLTQEKTTLNLLQNSNLAWIVYLLLWYIASYLTYKNIWYIPRRSWTETDIPVPLRGVLVGVTILCLGHLLLQLFLFTEAAVNLGDYLFAWIFSLILTSLTGFVRPDYDEGWFASEEHKSSEIRGLFEWLYYRRDHIRTVLIGSCLLLVFGFLINLLQTPPLLSIAGGCILLLILFLQPSSAVVFVTIIIMALMLLHDNLLLISGLLLLLWVFIALFTQIRLISWFAVLLFTPFAAANGFFMSYLYVVITLIRGEKLRLWQVALVGLGMFSVVQLAFMWIIPSEGAQYIRIPTNYINTLNAHITWANLNPDFFQDRLISLQNDYTVNSDTFISMTAHWWFDSIISMLPQWLFWLLWTTMAGLVSRLTVPLRIVGVLALFMGPIIVLNSLILSANDNYGQDKGIIALGIANAVLGLIIVWLGRNIFDYSPPPVVVGG